MGEVRYSNACRKCNKPSDSTTNIQTIIDLKKNTCQSPDVDQDEGRFNWSRFKKCIAIASIFFIVMNVHFLSSMSLNEVKSLNAINSSKIKNSMIDSPLTKPSTTKKTSDDPIQFIGDFNERFKIWTRQNHVKPVFQGFQVATGLK